MDHEDLSTLLWLTCGVQYWVKPPGSIGRVALKTSPSAAARHPLEAYVAVLRVRGLPRGLYHYLPDTHSLELLKKRLQLTTVRELSGGTVLVWLIERPDVHERRIRAQPVEVS
jgi:SagB-type dehydrogenase family enzyme